MTTISELLSAYRPSPDLANASTLPAPWYHAPAMHALEQEKIFAKTWQQFARMDRLAKPGDYVTGEIAGEPLVAVRDAAGELRVLSNVCRHRASPLLKGVGNAKSLACPYHGWTYALDGKLRSAREFEGAKDFRKEDVCLPRIRHAVWGPYLYVNLDPAAASFESVLGAIPGDVAAAGINLDAFKFHERREYVMNCNWKVYIENYQEGYHIPIVHPSLFRDLDYDRYEVQEFGEYSHHYAPLRQVENPDRKSRYTQDAGAQETRVFYYWVFPNLMVNIYPDNMSSNLILPLGPEKTLAVFEWFFTEEHLAQGGEWIKQNLDYSEGIQNEDVEICETVQRGLKSRHYWTGRLSPKRENGVLQFHRLLHARLNA